MQITGKLIQHLPIQTGEGSKGTWEKSGFIVEIPDNKYPKKVCFTTWGEMVSEGGKVSPGTEVRVSFDVESREYNDKWYSDIKAYKIEVNKNGSFVEPAKVVTSSKPVQTTINSNSNMEDDLPF